MKKIETAFILNQYGQSIASYADFTKEVGLWDAEKYVFQKYLKTSDDILDLGCGTGRTTFPLYQLGHKKIIGIDITPEMIDAAQVLNAHFATKINFQVGDARALKFPDATFDSLIFSFNGLMSIPRRAHRIEALKEINRVLKKDGIFIFTTHDRNKEAAFFEFWKAEEARWLAGTQNPELHEYGDLITQSKNEKTDIFIHIPDEAEVVECLEVCNFELIDSFYRIDKFQEREAVTVKSGECRFWVAMKSA